MKYAEAREKFIHAWETHAGSWGINRSMARLHALLLISPEPLSCEEIMSELQISRGNANMNLRSLIDWGIVYRDLRSGVRKEYFRAEKDIWKVARQIIRERRKRELEPFLASMEELKKIDGGRADKKLRTVHETATHIHKLMSRVDNVLEKSVKFEESVFVTTLMRLIK